MSGEGHGAFHPRGSPWLIAIIVTMAPFMEVLDTTIVNVSLPYIAGSLSASYDEATWTLTSYLVANGIIVPVSGWIGRVLGRKRYFLLCIAMFTLFSFLCGMATSLPQLVIFRLFQGLFGGGLQPNQQSIILDTFEPQDRGKGFSMVAVAVIFAPIAGPVLGGWLTDAFSWRWVFLINVPIGLFAFVGVLQLVEDPPWVLRDRARLVDIDYVGIALIGIGFGALQFVLDRGEDLDWFGSPQIRICALIATAGISGAVAWLLMVDRPVVSLRPLTDRNFAIASVVTFGIGLALYSSNVVIPLLSQTVFGYTALLAGWLMTPGAALMFILIPASARWVLPKLPTRHVIGFGFFALGCASLYAHGLTPDIDFWSLAMIRAIQTIGFAFLFVPNSTIGYSTLRREYNADATALYSMFRNIAGSIGIAVVTSLTVNRLQTHRAYLAEHMGPLDTPYQLMLTQHERALQSYGYASGAAHDAALGMLNHALTQQAAVLAYMDVFAFSAAAAFCVIPLTWLFRPGVAGRRR